MRMRKCCAGIVLASCFGYLSAVFAAPAPVNVYISKARIQNIPNTIQAFGHVEAIQSTNLSFVGSGRLTQILVRNGERVKKGQLIATLNDQAALAQLDSLQAQLKLDQTTYQRMLRIQKFGGISEQMIESKKAEVVQAKAQVKQQEVLIAQTQMHAPFQGVLGVFKYSVGAYLSAGSPLVSIVQQAPLKVKYSVPADLRSQLEIGQNVTVTSSAYKNKLFKGILSFVSPSVNKNTGTLILEARVQNPNFLLLPGMFVSVKQIINPNVKALVIPDMAILTDLMGQYIFSVSPNNIALKHYIHIIKVVGNLAVITQTGKNSLKPGQKIIISGQQKLSSGMMVHILKQNLN